MRELLKYYTALSGSPEAHYLLVVALLLLTVLSRSLLFSYFLCPPPLPYFAADAYDNDAVLKKPSLASVKRKESKLRRAKVRLSYTYLGPYLISYLTIPLC